MLVWVALSVIGWSGSVRFFCGDETRLGPEAERLRLRSKPSADARLQLVVSNRWDKCFCLFQATYLDGIVEPKTGDSFFYEFSHLNTDCFQMFLNLVWQQFKEDLLILQLDNGGFHKAKRLQVPANIILLFQPPHCQATFWGEDSPQKLAPELNPIEPVWQYLKRGLRWCLPTTLEQLRQQLKHRLEALTPSVIASITGRESILNALSVAKL